MSSTAPAIPEVTVQSYVHVRDVATQCDIRANSPGRTDTIAIGFGSWATVFIPDREQLALLAQKINEYIEANTAKDAEQAA